MAMLEGRCAHEATKKAKADDLARLEAIHARLERHAADGDKEAFFDANQEFHQAVQDLADNRWLSQMIQDLRKVLKLTRLHSLSLEGRLQQSLDEHRAIVAAICAKDAVTAERLMHDHLLSGREAAAKVDSKTSKVA